MKCLFYFSPIRNETIKIFRKKIFSFYFGLILTNSRKPCQVLVAHIIFLRFVAEQKNKNVCRLSWPDSPVENRSLNQSSVTIYFLVVMPGAGAIPQLPLLPLPAHAAAAHAAAAAAAVAPPRPSPMLVPPGMGIDESVSSPDSEWTEHKHTDGRIYYHNKTTKQSSWVKPDALKTPQEVLMNELLEEYRNFRGQRVPSNSNKDSGKSS